MRCNLPSSDRKNSRVFAERLFCRQHTSGLEIDFSCVTMKNWRQTEVLRQQRTVCEGKQGQKRFLRAKSQNLELHAGPLFIAPKANVLKDVLIVWTIHDKWLAQHAIHYKRFNWLKTHFDESEKECGDQNRWCTEVASLCVIVHVASLLCPGRLACRQVSAVRGCLGSSLVPWSHKTGFFSIKPCAKTT